MSIDTVTIDQLQVALDFFDEVSEIIEARQGQYAGPVENYARIKAGWDHIFGITIPVKKIALAMAWLKIARQINAIDTDQPNDDDWHDLAGYASNGYVLSQQERADNVRVAQEAAKDQARLKELAAANDFRPNMFRFGQAGVTFTPDQKEKIKGLVDYEAPLNLNKTRRIALNWDNTVAKETERIAGTTAGLTALGYRVEFTDGGKVIGYVNPGEKNITWLNKAFGG